MTTQDIDMQELMKLELKEKEREEKERKIALTVIEEASIKSKLGKQ